MIEKVLELSSICREDPFCNDRLPKSTTIHEPTKSLLKLIAPVITFPESNSSCLGAL